jgi:tetratricopeptide (TPR) repeat protein
MLADPSDITSASDVPPARRRRWWLILLILLCAWLGLGYARSQWDRQARQQADQTCEQAQQLTEAGDYQQARDLLSSVLEKFPEHARARSLYGQVFWQQGEVQRAREEWRRVGNSFGRDSARTRYLEGSALLDEHQTIPAETKLRGAAELDYEYLPPLERLAGLYSLQMRSTELRRTLVQIRDLRPLTFPEMAGGMLADTVSGDAQASLQRLRACMAADPADFASRIAAARVQLGQGDAEGALATLEQASRPSEVDVQAVRALALTRLDRLAEARGVLLRLAGQTPSSVLWRARSELLEKLGNRPAAISALLMAAVRSPFDVGLFQQLAQSLSHEPEDAELADAFLERARLLEVLEWDCVQMLHSEGQPPQVVGTRALDIVEQLFALHHDAFAVQWLQQAVALVPDDPRVKSLSARAASVTHDTWTDLLNQASQRYPERIAERARFDELPTPAATNGESSTAAPEGIVSPAE